MRAPNEVMLAIKTTAATRPVNRIPQPIATRRDHTSSCRGERIASALREGSGVIFSRGVRPLTHGASLSHPTSRKTRSTPHLITASIAWPLTRQEKNCDPFSSPDIVREVFNVLKEAPIDRAYDFSFAKKADGELTQARLETLETFQGWACRHLRAGESHDSPMTPPKLALCDPFPDLANMVGLSKSEPVPFLTVSSFSRGTKLIV